MEKRNKIFLITGIIIGIVISAIFCGIIVIVISNLRDDEFSRQTTLHIEGSEDYVIHGRFIIINRHKGDTLTFSFTTEPNGLIQVSLTRMDDIFPDLLFIATNITNYELIIPDDYCELSFHNLERFNITVSLNYKIN